MVRYVQTARTAELIELIDQHRDELESVLLEYGARNPRLFGSVVRGDADEGSDIDLLFTRPDGMGLFTMARMEHELSMVLGVPIDAIPDSTLYDHLRSQVLDEAVPL